MKKKPTKKAVPAVAAKKKATLKPVTTGNSTKFPIVAIGASAGGLEALEQFFSGMPVHTGFSFVVIQHLDPTNKGMMPELLQRLTKMVVLQAKDGVKAKPDCVYIIPPNKSMSILNGKLLLFEPLEIRGLRLPIDFFFRSLADDQKENSVGIILSGMGSDGTLGLRSIKEKGGLTLVQEPATAKFNGMPGSAVDAGLADIVAPALELPQKLIDIIKKLPIIKSSIQPDQKNQSSLDKIIILLRSATGNDFSLYKKNTLYRRIERRMGIHQIDKIASYVRYLQENSKEAEILFKELLIGVTNFFRDAPMWEELKSKILPAYLAKKPSGYVFRIWVPACSSGEEAYTLAIVVKEAIEKLKEQKNFTVQVFATDLDNDSIEIARKGVYPESIVADVTAARLKKFFVKEGAFYRIGSEIRESVVFAPQNVIADPPFTRLDIISCRNMLIYMENELQEQIFSLFYYSLLEEGILLLGNAETISNSKLFTGVDKKLRIYSRNANKDNITMLDFPVSFSLAKPNVKEMKTQVKQVVNIQTAADQLLLQNFAPAGVLVNDKGDIVYVSGRTGKYLEPAAGKTNWNIFAMLRDGMQVGFSAAFRKAITQKTSITISNLEAGLNGNTQLVDIIISWVEKPVALQGMLMVVFKDKKIVTNDQAAPKKIKQTKNITEYNELNLELKHAREELQTTFEEMQAAQEELKSTNEELQSTNEELQSSNEELTTSKEEMQSMNEELQSVNSELQIKVEDFSRVNNDMKNLLESTDIATLFLTKDLKVRGFTDKTTGLIKLIKSDIGRPFTDLSSNLLYAEFETEAKEVLHTLVFKEKRIATIDDNWFSVRIMPYRTFDDRIDGLVITFINITASVNIEIALQKTTSTLRSIISTADAVIIGLADDGTIKEFNIKAEKLFDKKRNDVIGHKYIDMFIPAEERKKLSLQMNKLLQGKHSDIFRNNVLGAGNSILKIEWTVNQLMDEKGKNSGIIIIGQHIVTK